MKKFHGYYFLLFTMMILLITTSASASYTANGKVGLTAMLIGVFTEAETVSAVNTHYPATIIYKQFNTLILEPPAKGITRALTPGILITHCPKT